MTCVLWAILHRDIDSDPVTKILFDSMASSNLTFDGGQDKLRSNNVKFSNKYFCIKANVSDSAFPQDFKSAVSFFYDDK